MSSPKLRSMTGIGLGSVPLGNGVVSVELRAVNHRHLDLRVRVSPELADDSVAIEEEARASCVRGRIEISARWEARELEGAPLDMVRARTFYQSLLSLRDELAPGQEVPVTALLQVPGLFTAAVRLDPDERAVAVRKATLAAARDLDEMRAREGAALAKDFEARLTLLEGHTQWIEAQRPTLIEGIRTRMHKRIEKLLEGTDVTLDPSRLLQEIAWFADKSDIAEEITRLLSHIEQFRGLVRGTAESTGKKLDFLVQEMGREVNTIGSKANDALIAHRVIEMKAELERIREQVQNVL